MNVNITDDDYTIDDVEFYGPNVDIHENYSNDPYCVAELRGSCAHSYWLLFKLVPLAFHALGCALQCLAWANRKEFTPQQRQYDVVLLYIYPQWVSTIQESCERPVAAGDHVALVRHLSKEPFDSVFAFLEMLTVVYVWGELMYPPVYCGAVRPLSLYYYPIIMTLLELTKFNMYLASRLFQEGRHWQALLSLLNFEVLLTNIWICITLAGVFATACVTFVCSFVWRQSRCLHTYCCSFSGGSIDDNVWDKPKPKPNPTHVSKEPEYTSNPIVRVGDVEGGEGAQTQAQEVELKDHIAPVQCHDS